MLSNSAQHHFRSKQQPLYQTASCVPFWQWRQVVYLIYVDYKLKKSQSIHTIIIKYEPGERFWIPFNCKSFWILPITYMELEFENENEIYPESVYINGSGYFIINIYQFMF